MGILKQWGSEIQKIEKEIYVIYLAYRNPKMPWYAKFFIVCVVGYALSPIDLIPDFIPIIGHLDDFILVPLGVVLAVKMIPIEILEECKKQAEVGHWDRKKNGKGFKMAILPKLKRSAPNCSFDNRAVTLEWLGSASVKILRFFCRFFLRENFLRKIRLYKYIFKESDIINKWSVYLINSSVWVALYRDLIRRGFINFNKIFYKIKYSDGLVLYSPLNNHALNRADQNYLQYFSGFDCKGKNILDIGSHIGTFSIPFAIKYPSSDFYCYEIDLANCLAMKKTILYSHLKNVHVINKCVYSRNGEIQIARGGATTSSVQESGFFATSPKANTYRIEGITLREIFENYCPDHCEILKIDVEGAAYEIFRNNYDLLNRVKYLAIDLHCVRDMLPQESELYQQIYSKFNVVSENFPSIVHGKKIIEIVGINKNY